MGDMVEKVARVLAARKMVMEDGGALPDDLWQQCVPAARATLEACHHEELVTALKRIAELQDDKCQTASAELLYAILDIKVGVARAALAKVEASDA